jgi:transposase InsO family protein
MVGIAFNVQNQPLSVPDKTSLVLELLPCQFALLSSRLSRSVARTCTQYDLSLSEWRVIAAIASGRAKSASHVTECFTQSVLHEWAHGWTYQNSAQRTRALLGWQHHYNRHRPHAGIGGAFPMSRLNSSRQNLLTVHSQLPTAEVDSLQRVLRRLSDNPRS